MSSEELDIGSYIDPIASEVDTVQSNSQFQGDSPRIPTRDAPLPPSRDNSGRSPSQDNSTHSPFRDEYQQIPSRQESVSQRSDAAASVQHDGDRSSVGSERFIIAIDYGTTYTGTKPITH